MLDRVRSGSEPLRAVRIAAGLSTPESSADAFDKAGFAKSADNAGTGGEAMGGDGNGCDGGGMIGLMGGVGGGRCWLASEDAPGDDSVAPAPLLLSR